MSFTETPPWIPLYALTPMEHDNSNQVLGLQSHVLLAKAESEGRFHDSSVNNTRIRQQNAVKQSFESFAKRALQHQPGVRCNSSKVLAKS